MAPIPTYQAGQAFVAVNPSLRNFHREVKAEVQKIRGVTVPVTAEVDVSKIRPALTAATRSAPKATIRAEADTTGARRSIARLGINKPIRIATEADTAKARADIDQVGRSTPDITVKAKANTAKAEADIGAFATKAQLRLEKALTALPDVELTIKSTEAERRLQVIRNEIGHLADKRIGVDIDSEKFESELARLRRELGSVAEHKTATIQVKTDAAAAMAALQAVGQRARRLDSDRVNVNVNAQDVSRAISLVGLLTAALAGVSAAGAPALAALAAIPALGGAAALGLGAFVVGVSGVGDAVKALQQEDTKAAAGTAVSAASRVNSAQAIASAQRQVQQATTQADRAAITGAQQVDDARRAVADAYTQGARQIAQAEQGVRQAQLQVTDAQLGLNRARLEAIERNEDLRLSLRGVAIDEREALLDLRDAQAKLNEGLAAGVSGDEMERLRISVDRAQLGLEQTRERFGDLRAESAEYARTGVEGSREVVAAQRQVADAATGVRDAERQLAQVRADSDKQVADARRQEQRAAQQAGWAEADAAKQVEDAQIALRNAYQDTGTQGAAAGNKVAEAMSGLSPEAQRFARFLSSDVIPGLQGVRAEVQRSLLPRLETSLRNGATLAPIFADGLRDAGQVVGDLAVRGSEMVSSGPWRSDFGTILAANNRIFGDFGEVGLSSADAMRSITIEGQPMVERFAQATQRGAEMADQWVQTKRATGELDTFFRAAGDTLAEFGDIALQIVTGVVNLTNALGPLGMVVLHTVGAVAELVGDFAQAHPTITQVIATGVLAAAMFIKLGSAVGGLRAVLAATTSGWANLSGVIAAFGPAAVQERLARWTGLVDTQGMATERAATSGGKFLGALTKVGAALPVVSAALVAGAAAWDGITISSAEAADAINKGGVEAETARRQIDVMQRGTEGWLGVLRPFITTQEEATQAARAQRAELGPLARAQLDAQKATNDYQLALRDYSPASDEAKAAAERAKTAQDALRYAQDAARGATKGHTEAILEQQGVMQGALSADLAYRQALQDVHDQLGALGGSTKLTTDQSLQLESSMIRVAEAAKQRELANYADKTSVDAVSASNQAYNRAIWDLIVSAGTNAPAALTAYIGKLSESELRAIGARVETDNLGHRVIALPDDKFINIASSAPKVADEVRTLDKLLRDLPNTTFADVVLRPALRQPKAPAATNLPLLVGPAYQRATGGEIHGPGTTTSDSILLRASDGEHMWSAAEVAGAGGHTRVERLRGLARAGQLPAFATGGAIGGLSGGVSPRFGTAPASIGVSATLDITDPSAAAAAFTTVSEVLTGTFAPALEQVQQLAGIDTAMALQELLAQVPPLAQATVDSGLQIQTTWATNTAAVTTAQQKQIAQFAALQANLGLATQGMTQSVRGLQAANNASWLNMQTVTQGSVGYITGPIFGGLHAGMDWVAQHAAAMRGGWAGQLAGLQPAAADPIRWIMQFPLGPPGIAASWNTLDAQFRLGKHINPPAPGFAEGGPIRGAGTGTSDSIVARVSDGEFIVREAVASRVPHFLKALNAGQAEAIQAAGGPGARMPGFALGGLIAVRDFAQRNQGRPYIWGGVGPTGWDCSGWVSSLVNVARGQNPYRRVGATNNFPWSGFLPGLRGSFSVGAFKGDPGHMAATVGGVNTESGGPHNNVAWGGPAVGADSGQFNIRAFLPEIGGVFAPGGPGGGSGFDPTPMVEAAFRRAYEMVADVTRFHGGSDFVTGNQTVARQEVDEVKGKALERLTTMFAADALGPLGAGAPFYVGEISRAAKVRGLGVDAAVIGTATSLVETNLRNLANRAVPASLKLPNDGLGSDHDSVGLFQQRQAGWGTVQQRMNPFASAGMFFDRLKAFDWRRMDPGAAAQRVQRSAYPGRYSQRMGQASGLVRMHGGTFDRGGWIPPGYSTIYNGTGQREVAAVFNNRQWRDLHNIATTGPGDKASVTNNWHVYESHDASATAMSIQRRQEMRARTGAPL